MGRVNTPVITSEVRDELEKGFRKDKRHCYRMRCKTILLKAEGKTSKEVGEFVNMSDVSVNAWVRRFNSEGISGLETRPGRGKKPVLTVSEDSEGVKKIIKKNLLRIDMMKKEWESFSGKSVSCETFRNFLKALADDLD
ncbi:MAG: helix-turn-helix domain-containing protein [Cytophagales bacterium]|nr:helix-turn-helix domain-containing protein [Cytophagales bacterium]